MAEGPGAKAGAGTTDVRKMRRVAVVSIVAHILALVLFLLMLDFRDLWDTLVVVAVITYLIGIVSGAVMLFASSTLLCGVCSVFFAGVAVTDVIIMVAWFHFADTLRALYIVLWMVPSIIGALACYEGSAKAFWVERD